MKLQQAWRSIRLPEAAALAVWASLAAAGDMATMGDEAAFLFGGAEDHARSGYSLSAEAQAGKKLFRRALFGGNERTCLTCHRLNTGTISTGQVQQAFIDDPDDPLFRALDSDDGSGYSYEQLLTHSTFVVSIPMHPNVRLADTPTADTFFVRRSTLSVNNIALDPVLMWDGRDPDLETQAQGAIEQHAEATEVPTRQELEQIAAFQVEALFSSRALRSFANGWPEPQLPPGKTGSEKRGREFFIPRPDRINCALCHSGPMLNEVSEIGRLALAPPVQAVFPAGFRFANTFVSLFNATGQPVYDWELTRPDGSVRTFSSPDPGRALITGREVDIERFKIPTLWGVRKTAPYLHDNSAATLEALMQFYDRGFRHFGGPGFTPQEQADIVAYLKLL